MNPTYNNQPVVARLRKVQDAYAESFPADRKSGCCLWEVKSQEDAQMITGMVLTEATDGAIFDDLFLMLTNNEAGKAGYPRACVEELHALLAAAEKREGLGLAATFLATSPHATSFGDVARYAAAIHAQLLGADRVVLYLYPQQIHDDALYADSIVEALEAGLPEGVIVMLCAGTGQEVYRRLAEPDNLGVTIIDPDLNMEAVVSDISATGDPTDPNVRFNQLYAGMAQAGTAGEFAAVRDYAQRAIALVDGDAERAHLPVIVLAAQAAIFISHKSLRREGIHVFQQAGARAAALVESSGEANRPLLVQALMGEAGGEYQTKNYATAAEKYAEAAKAAGETNDYLRYESLRMATDAYARTRQFEVAYRAGLEALVTAERLPPEATANSTLPYLGVRLLDLVAVLNRSGEGREIDARVSALAGTDWRQSIN